MSDPHAKAWLADKHYTAVLRKIEAVESIWRGSGKKTRRNWWDILAGTSAGKRKVLYGIEFPIIAAARDRKGWPAVRGALCHGDGEEAPVIVAQARWENHTKSHP